MDTTVIDRIDIGWFKAVAKKRYAECTQAGLSSREAVGEAVRFAIERAVEKSDRTRTARAEQSVLDRLLAQTRDGARAIIKRL